MRVVDSEDGGDGGEDNDEDKHIEDDKGNGEWWGHGDQRRAW